MARQGNAAANVSSPDVATWLRERIRKGTLVPGQRLIEIDIIKATGASRSRVREALQRMEVEGLVSIEEFRGASVRSFTPDEIRQIYRTRMALEGLAAHDFALSPSIERKNELKRVQRDMNALEKTGDHAGFVRLNDEWHEVIIDGAENEYVRTFVARLRLPLYQLLFAAFYKPHRIDDANAGHRKITEAILAGDAVRAEQLMRDHIEEALGAIAFLEEDSLG